MKRTFNLVCLLLGVSFFFNACTTTKRFAKSHPDVSSFVGVWVGESRKANSLTTWVQKRSEDGTYMIFFIKIEGNEVTRSFESGRWWLDDGKFYEITHDSKGEPHVYHYTIVSEELIFFDNVTVDYKFADKRIKDTNLDVIPLKNKRAE